MDIGLGPLMDAAEASVRGIFTMTSRAKSGGHGGMFKGATKGLHVMLGGDLLFSGATARRHHMLSSMAGAIVGNISSVALGIATGGTSIPLTMVANIAGDFATRGPTARFVQSILDLPSQLMGIHMGGNYKDTEIAQTMRQKAAQEMQGSLLNARQYLGKEALLLHQ